MKTPYYLFRKEMNFDTLSLFLYYSMTFHFSEKITCERENILSEMQAGSYWIKILSTHVNIELLTGTQVIEYVVATNNPSGFVPVITFRLSEFYEHKPIIMIFPFCFLSTPHCLTLICISNFYPDNWSQTSCSGLSYGKEQLNTNQGKSFFIQLHFRWYWITLIGWERR